MLKLRPTVSLKQTLKLSQILSPKIIQTLKAYGMGYTDLVNRITHEAEENVALEIVQFDRLSHYGHRPLLSTIDPTDIAQSARSRSDSDQLHTHLIHQIEMEGWNERDQSIAFELISAIDDRGYINDFVSIRHRIMAQFDVDERKVLAILRKIQGLEPDGVGARNLPECLLLQIEAHHFENDRLREVFKQFVSQHLDDYAREDFEKISESMGIDIDGVEAISRFIKNNLSPFPGHKFSKPIESKPVIPSFEVDIIDDTLSITNLEETQGVQIGISERYQQLANHPDTDHETRLYIAEQIKKVTELIELIQHRRQSLENTVTYILKKQIEFIRRGPNYLVPLQQNVISNEVGLSASSISRLVNSKYIQTPHGMISLRHLCPRNHFGLTARQLSQTIGDALNEFPGYSDQKIAMILNSRGIPIARRTVTKYRLIRGVQSSYTRDE